jgi:hypothetical protein
LKQIDFDGKSNYSEIIKIEIGIPEITTLYQNYPNPFNPTTTIRFDIKEKNFVNISVYNLLGEKVEELVKDVLDSGKHEVYLDASGMASGVYFYHLSVKNQYSKTVKMTLMR